MTPNIPAEMNLLIQKATDLHVLNAKEAFSLGVEFGDNYDRITREILECAYFTFGTPAPVIVVINKAISLGVIDPIYVFLSREISGDNYPQIVGEIQRRAHILGKPDYIGSAIDSMVEFYHRESNYKEDQVETPPAEEKPNFDDAFASFFRGCREKTYKYYDNNYPNMGKPEFSIKVGRRYIKVVSGTSVHCFVDTTNGDVLKAASWKAPASSM